MKRISVSVLIKALNEEAKISACIEAAVREVATVGGEVILVDSISTDRTVEIACSFPVSVIQFSSVADRGCGAAVQLGYQYALGEYIYVLDGDMELQHGFLSLALNFLKSHPEVGGVSGKLVDLSVKTANDKRRVSRALALQQPQEVSELGGGGLYRRIAIESVGYLAHRWLAACEEAELGARLRAKGWRLARLPTTAVFHTGYSESDWQMLARMWRSRRMHAFGMYLRSAFGQPWWWLAVRQAWFVLAAPVIHLLVGIFIIIAVHFLLIEFKYALLISEFFTWSFLFIVMAIKKRNVHQALLALCTWHLYSLAALTGMFRVIGNPEQVIDSRVYHQAAKISSHIV